MSSLNRDVAVNTLSNIGLAILGAGSGSFVSYRFGADGRGVIGAAQVIAALSAAIGSIGLGDALLYAFASGATLRRRTIVGASMLAAACGAVLGAGVGLIVVNHLNVGGHRSDFVLFCSLVSAGTAFYTIPNGVMRGIGRFPAWNLLRLSAAVAWIVALVVGGLQSRLQLGLIAVVYAATLATLSGASLAMCQSRYVSFAHPTGPRSLRKLLRFGLPSAFASAPLLLNARVDQVALAVSSSAADVGHYAAAAGYCWATVPLGQAIANVMATRVASQTDPAKRIATLRALTGIGVTVIGLSGAVAIAVAPVALRVLNGPGFGAAVGIARVLLVGATFQGMTTLLEEGARGLGQPRLPMWAEVLGLLAMAILLLFLSRHGSVPTAIASTAGYLVSFAVITRGVSQVTATNIKRLLWPVGLRRVRPIIREL
jgi:antigen flippase